MVKVMVMMLVMMMIFLHLITAHGNQHDIRGTDDRTKLGIIPAGVGEVVKPAGQESREKWRARRCRHSARSVSRLHDFHHAGPGLENHDPGSGNSALGSRYHICRPHFGPSSSPSFLA